MSSLMRDLIDEVRVLAVRNHELRTAAARNEFILNYIEAFIEVHMDDKLAAQIAGRIDDLRETSNNGGY